MQLNEVFLLFQPIAHFGTLVVTGVISDEMNLDGFAKRLLPTTS